MRKLVVGSLAVVGAGALSLAGCSGGTTEPAPEPEPAVEAPAEPGPALLMAQAWFIMDTGEPDPQPAKLVILRRQADGTFQEELLLDPDSNVFHKAMPWRDGILTIGAEGAVAKHWTRSEAGEWTATQLWSQSWGGQFDRLRDVEIGDVDGDGEDELVIVTHDQGVVAVGDEADGAWTFVEMDKTADTFVHEVEIGDVDGDGTLEFYVTPSGRNQASGVSQPGGVVRYDYVDGAYVRSDVVQWDSTHAKEILVADIGSGPQLFAVREGHVERDGGRTELIDPVRIYRYDRTDGAWGETLVASVSDHQTRFLVPGDIDGDGTVELLAAGFKSGLWRLEPREDGTFEPTLIDRATSGFEHATHVADLDGDGTLEIYVAADDQRKLRQYVWNGAAFDRNDIFDIGDFHLTWNLQDGNL